MHDHVWNCAKLKTSILSHISQAVNIMFLAYMYLSRNNITTIRRKLTLVLEPNMGSKAKRTRMFSARRRISGILFFVWLCDCYYKAYLASFLFLVFASVLEEERSICFSYLFLSISSLGEERVGLYVSRICFCPSARLEKREQVYMFLVFVSVHQLAWGRESRSICFSYLFLSISSLGEERASLYVSRAFVCLFGTRHFLFLSLPIGAMSWLQLVIVGLPRRFTFYAQCKA